MQVTFAFYCVIAYLLVITVVGIYYGKKVKTQEDYSVAGRSLPTPILIGTLMATWMGAGTVLGGPAASGYQYGLMAAIAFSMGSPVGQFVLSFVAKKIRRMNAQTVPEVIEKVYGSLARVLATVIIMLAYIGIVAYQYKGVGLILNSILGVPENIGTLIAFGVIVVTALFGGLYSVAYTDFLSCCMMMAGLFIGVPMAISMAGGWSWVAANIPPGHLGFGSISFPQLLGFFFPVFFYVMGDQNMYQRFFAAKDEKTAMQSGIGWMLGCTATYFFVAAAAIAARALYPNINAAQSFVHLATHGMPTIIGGICVAAITAFIVTTANSFLLSVGVNMSWDVYAASSIRRHPLKRSSSSPGPACWAWAYWPTWSSSTTLNSSSSSSTPIPCTAPPLLRPFSLRSCSPRGSPPWEGSSPSSPAEPSPSHGKPRKPRAGPWRKPIRRCLLRLPLPYWR
ncbi:MAG TPA: sodium:solute symporter family protein [Aminivibrio sp.]|nr:sodium:solute symporter family protein [Aminivibrio sp.]